MIGEIDSQTLDDEVDYTMLDDLEQLHRSWPVRTQLIHKGHPRVPLDVKPRRVRASPDLHRSSPTDSDLLAGVPSKYMCQVETWLE